MTDGALVCDPAKVKELAAARHDEFEVMRYMLQMDNDLEDKALDEFVELLAEPIAEAIDCTECGNCCHSLDVYLTPDDIPVVAEGCGFPEAEVIQEYVDLQTAKSVGEWGKFRRKPCPFLAGKLCSIYASRPSSCRQYPVFTPDFRWTLKDLIAGASICPIIYNVLDQMMESVDELIASTV